MSLKQPKPPLPTATTAKKKTNSPDTSKQPPLTLEYDDGFAPFTEAWPLSSKTGTPYDSTIHALTQNTLHAATQSMQGYLASGYNQTPAYRTTLQNLGVALKIICGCSDCTAMQGLLVSLMDALAPSTIPDRGSAYPPAWACPNDHQEYCLDCVGTI